MQKPNSRPLQFVAMNFVQLMNQMTQHNKIVAKFMSNVKNLNRHSSNSSFQVQPCRHSVDKSQDQKRITKNSIVPKEKLDSLKD